jgi:hypothetical protein
MLLVGSGYAVLSGAQAGNVLLAFSAEQSEAFRNPYY